MIARNIAPRGALVLALLAIAACRDGGTPATVGATEPPKAQLADFLPTTPFDSARLEALRFPWQWVGAVHHQAMQEALEDPNVPTYVGRGPSSAACAAQIRYAKRYVAEIDAIAINLHTERASKDDAEAIARKLGVCRREGSTATIPNSAVGRYASQLASSLHAARNVADARRIIDATHLDALHDPKLSDDDLQTIAALTVVALASTSEWYPLGARKSETRRADPRIVAVTNDISDPVDPDVLGCALMGGSGFDCAIGALLGSLAYWWPY